MFPSDMNGPVQSAERWYVVRSKPRGELTAKAQLERQEFCVFFPRILQSARVRGRWVDRVEPLFPRYLFLRANAARRSLAPVRSTMGVTEIVRFGAEYATVPQSIVQQLMNRADPDTGLHKLEAPLLACGVQVRIVAGPFNGLEGIFESHEGEKRVSILLEMLGKQTRVCMSVNQVVPCLAA